MKTLLIFTLYLISGPAGSVNVIGFSGGSMIMICKENKVRSKSFCKMTSANTCGSPMYTTDRRRWVNRNRLYLYDAFSNDIVVVHRRLVTEDTGLYQCAENGAWSYIVDLEVKKDPCCSGPKNMTGYLGKTVTISCSYPVEFQTYTKYLYKLKGPNYSELASSSYPEGGRFSISEDRGSRVVSVRIRDVREDDGGDYFCGVKISEEFFEYVSLYTEIQLQVTAPASPVIIITVSICVVLLLIGGLTLIFYKLKYSKIQGNVSPNTPTGTADTTDGDYMIMKSRPALDWLQPIRDSTTKPTGQIQPATVSDPKLATPIQSTTATISKTTSQFLPTRTTPPKPTNQILPTKTASSKPNDQIQSPTASVPKPTNQVLFTRTAPSKPTNQNKPTTASTTKPTNQIYPTQAATPKPTKKVQFNLS